MRRCLTSNRLRRARQAVQSICDMQSEAEVLPGDVTSGQAALSHDGDEGEDQRANANPNRLASAAVGGQAGGHIAAVAQGVTEPKSAFLYQQAF